MFSSKSKKMPDRESWVDFKEKFGRQGSKTKILESLSIVSSNDSYSRRAPQRSVSVGGPPTSARHFGTNGNSFGVGQTKINAGASNRRRLFKRTKSHGNIKIGEISHHRSLSSKAA